MTTENQTHIPIGWKEYELGELLDYKQPYKYIVACTEYSKNSGIPVLTAGKSFILGYTDESENIYNDLPVVIFDDFTTDSKYVDFPFKVKSSAMKFLLPKNEIDLFFVFAHLQRLRFRDVSGDHKRMWISEFSKLKIVLPTSPTEQQKIASILSKLDEAITQTEQLIGKYKKIKEGLMHDLLTRGIDEQGNIRSEETHKFKDSPLGRIPEEWECCEIGNACYVTKLSGFEFTKYMEYRDDGEIIAIRAMNIKNEQLILDDVQRISKKVSEFLVRSKLHSGDILITYIGAYIGDILQIKEDNKYHLAPNVAKIVGGPKLTPDFLEFMMRSTKVQRFIKSLVTTTANPSLTMGQIRTVYIIYPKDKKEQDRISKRLSTLNILINKTSSELEKLFLQKSGLMHDLLTGKIRVQI